MFDKFEKNKFHLQKISPTIAARLPQKKSVTICIFTSYTPSDGVS